MRSAREQGEAFKQAKAKVTEMGGTFTVDRAKVTAAVDKIEADLKAKREK